MRALVRTGSRLRCRSVAAVSDPGTASTLPARPSRKPKETEWQRRKRRDKERAKHVAIHGPACMICGNVPKRGLDQDHDHRSGKTRGWLDHRCNRALPTWVTPEWLRAAADYLERSST